MKKLIVSLILITMVAIGFASCTSSKNGGCPTTNRNYFKP